MPAQVINFSSTTIDSVTRTAITVPVECSVVTLINADNDNDATLYDAASGGNSMPLTRGTEKVFRPTGRREVVWRPNDIVAWVTASAGTGPIRAEFLS